MKMSTVPVPPDKASMVPSRDVLTYSSNLISYDICYHQPSVLNLKKKSKYILTMILKYVFVPSHVTGGQTLWHDCMRWGAHIQSDDIDGQEAKRYCFRRVNLDWAEEKLRCLYHEAQVWYKETTT